MPDPSDIPEPEVENGLDDASDTPEDPEDSTPINEEESNGK